MYKTSVMVLVVVHVAMHSLSPHNSAGGDIVMRSFVCGRVSRSVRPSRFALSAQYRLQCLPDHFQTSLVSFS